MKSASEIETEMAGFSGTEEYHRISPLHGNLVLTDGAFWLAGSAECFWLFDLIASYQPRCRKDKMLRDIQFWKLQVNADKSAVIRCERDTNNVAFAQQIPYTTFPLSALTLYVEAGACGEKPVMVCMLPGER